MLYSGRRRPGGRPRIARNAAGFRGFPPVRARPVRAPVHARPTRGCTVSEAVRLHRWDEIALEKVTEMISRKFVTGHREMLAQVYLKRGAVVPMHAAAHGAAGPFL